MTVLANYKLDPIALNTGTATYQLPKYLATTLSNLSKSQYIVNSRKDFITQLKHEVVPDAYQKSPKITDPKIYRPNIRKNFWLEKNKHYNYKKCHKRPTFIGHKECTVFFDDSVYLQNDGVGMRYPLGPILAGIIMVELMTNLFGNKIVPTVINYIVNRETFR